MGENFAQKILHYINGEWREIDTTEYVEVVNPATQDLLAKTPLLFSPKVDPQKQKLCAPALKLIGLRRSFARHLPGDIFAEQLDGVNFAEQ